MGGVDSGFGLSSSACIFTLITYVNLASIFISPAALSASERGMLNKVSVYVWGFINFLGFCFCLYMLRIRIVMYFWGNCSFNINLSFVYLSLGLKPILSHINISSLFGQFSQHISSFFDAYSLSVWLYFRYVFQKQQMRIFVLFGIFIFIEICLDIFLLIFCILNLPCIIFATTTFPT